jgi:hypothetical protein
MTAFVPSFGMQFPANLPVVVIGGERFFRERETGLVIDKSGPALNKMRFKKTGPEFFLVGRSALYPLAGIAAYIEHRRVKTDSKK